VTVEELTKQERETPTPVKDLPPPHYDGPTGGSRKRRITLIVVGLVVLGIALLVVRGLHHHPVRAPRFNRGRGDFRAAALGAGPVSVAVARASLGNIVVRIPALGTVTPLNIVTVQSQISGYLESIDFKEGQMVKKGQLLAVIDPRPYEAALTEAKGNLLRDQGELAGAESDLARYEQEIKQDAVSEQQLVDERFLVSQYKGAVESDKGAVAAAAVNVSYCHIVSPISGRVGLMQVYPGNYVTPNEANGIVVVTQLEPTSVIFPIAETYIEGIEQRVAAGAKLEVEAYDAANTTLLTTGYLRTLDNEINTTTGTVSLRAVFENKNDILFPNEFVNVKLVENVLQHQLVIPIAAVRHGAATDGLADYVYLVNPNHTVSVRAVELGTSDTTNVQVKSGLADGDLVVTEGADRLHDGARVMLPGQAGPAGHAGHARRARRPG